MLLFFNNFIDLLLTNILCKNIGLKKKQEKDKEKGKEFH